LRRTRIGKRLLKPRSFQRAKYNSEAFYQKIQIRIWLKIEDLGKENDRERVCGSEDRPCPDIRAG
jgi:hypothetical protein